MGSGTRGRPFGGGGEIEAGEVVEGAVQELVEVVAAGSAGVGGGHGWLCLRNPRRGDEGAPDLGSGAVLPAAGGQAGCVWGLGADRHARGRRVREGKVILKNTAGSGFLLRLARDSLHSHSRRIAIQILFFFLFEKDTFLSGSSI